MTTRIVAEIGRNNIGYEEYSRRRVEDYGIIDRR